MANTDYYKNQENRIALAREMAQEGIVLLKNQGLLPLKPQKLAVFGRSCLDSVQGGFGSGASRGGKEITLCDALREAGFETAENIENIYRRELEGAGEKSPFGGNGVDGEAAFLAMIASGAFYEWFGTYTPPTDELHLEEAEVLAAAQATDTALLVIGRSCGGEECDRRPSDYCLLEEEKRLVELVCGNFPKVIVVSNEVGLIDLAWTADYPAIQALLSMGPAGERGMQALVDILSGAVSPSGKLGQTMVLSLEDHPASKYFSSNKDDPDSLLSYGDFGLSEIENGVLGLDRQIACVYGEDIYVGYRYFDTANVPVLYPFGYGLSYTEFSLSAPTVTYNRETESITLSVCVKNAGQTYSGKEVVQVYAAVPALRLKQPYKKLVGFEKTGLLAPGTEETVSVEIPIRQIASYDEASACYILEPGTYGLLVSTGDEAPAQVAAFSVAEEIVTDQYSNHLGLKTCNRDFPFLALSRPMTVEAAPAFTLSQADVSVAKAAEVPVFSGESKGFVSWEDVCTGKATVAEFTAQLCKEELAQLCVGLDSGVTMQKENVPLSLSYPDGTPIGTNSHPFARLGSLSPAMEKYGLPSISYSDGPAGTGGTSWPVELVQARTWNKALIHEFGIAAGLEAQEKQIDAWLAPAINIERFVLGGRNFEYYSEDPVLSGALAAAMVTGAAENPGLTTCPKHFAVNEQETYRRGKAGKKIGVCDSIVTERAAREIYLKPFEMAIRTGAVHSIMTSFNKINGTFSGGRRDLCNDILRGEWGFEGAVVTDWGDLDFVVNSGDAVRAGNDITMPGGPRYAREILDAMQDGRLTMTELRTAAANALNFFLGTKSAQKPL